MKILPVLLFLLALHSFARAGVPEMIAEVRRAGEKLGFSAIHHTRATAGLWNGKRSVFLEETWIDLKTGAFKQITYDRETDAPNPLAAGVLPADLPARSGRWQTDGGQDKLPLDPTGKIGRLYFSEQRPEWRVVFDPAQSPFAGMPKGSGPTLPEGRRLADPRERVLSTLSPVWEEAFRAEFSQSSTVPLDFTYPSLEFTAAEEETHLQPSPVGPSQDEITTWRGLARRRVRSFQGNVMERRMTQFEASVDLAFPPAQQELVAKEHRMFSKVDFSKPSNPTSMGPQRSFGYSPFPFDEWKPVYRLATVFKDSPAAKAGLRRDDVVLSINGQDLAALGGRKELFAFLKTVPDKVELVIQRSESANLTVTLEKVETNGYMTPESRREQITKDASSR